MKKTYIAPASQLKMVAAQQMMMTLSVSEEPAEVTEGNNTEKGDALVKSYNVWDAEW